MDSIEWLCKNVKYFLIMQDLRGVFSKLVFYIPANFPAYYRVFTI